MLSSTLGCPVRFNPAGPRGTGMALNPAVLYPRKKKLQVTEMATSKSLFLKWRKVFLEYLWKSFPLGVLQLHCCVPLKIPPQGRREQQLPSEEGPSEVETGLLDRVGVESPPVMGGRVSRGSGRERDVSSETRSPIPLPTAFLGNGCLTSLRVPWVHAGLSESHTQCGRVTWQGGSGRGSHPESRCRLGL